MNFFVRHSAQCILAATLLLSIHASFSAHGFVNTGLDMHSGSYNKYIPDMHGAIQPDGKIVVVGTCYKADLHAPHHPQAQIMVVRYNPDGSCDTSFGTHGYSMLPVAQHNSFGIDVALQKSGKIIVAGRRFDRGGWLGEAILARLHSDGSLDRSFGNNGVASLSCLELDYANFFRMKLRNDDSIVACGNWGSYRPLSKNLGCRADQFIQEHAFERSGFCTAQFNADGVLDTQFGNSGIVVTYSADRLGLQF